MKPLFLFRPEPGWSVSAETARAMGLEVGGAPLQAIEPVAWQAPPPDQFDGLLVGSANAFRQAGRQLSRLTRLPVHAVGEATADAARSAGFLVGRTGEGGLQAVLDALAGRELRLLRLAGEQRAELATPDGILVDTRTVYRAVPCPLSEDDAMALRGGGVAALHSGAAVDRLIEELDRLGIDRGRFDILAIGPRVAERAGAGWRSVQSAAAPADSEMLALAKALCQTAG